MWRWSRRPDSLTPSGWKGFLVVIQVMHGYLECSPVKNDYYVHWPRFRYKGVVELVLLSGAHSLASKLRAQFPLLPDSEATHSPGYTIRQVNPQGIGVKEHQ